MQTSKMEVDRVGEVAFSRYRGIRPYLSKAGERAFSTCNGQLSSSQNLAGSNFDLQV